MDMERIQTLAEHYRNFLLQGVDIKPERIDINRTFGDCTPFELRCHALYLCDGLIKITKNPEQSGKANRHLTAIQMILSFLKMYTLAELMEHNRPT